jgi:hypothetical protein
MLSKCKFNEALSSFELPAQGSNRGYSPAQLIEGLFAGVWCGAGCFEHLDTIRYDKTLGTMLGWKRNADHRGCQEVSAKGYNPCRPGRKSVHPLLAFVADIRMVANYLLRPGNTGATTNSLSFLENTLCGIDYIKFCRTAIFFYSRLIYVRILDGYKHV